MSILYGLPSISEEERSQELSSPMLIAVYSVMAFRRII